MNKMLKKMVALLAAGSVLLAGCGQKDATERNILGEPEASGGSVSGTENPEEADTVLTPLGKYEEPVTVSISKVMITNPHLIEGQSPEDNIMLDWIRDELNINVEIAWQAESSEYNNKLSLNMASGNLPDIIYIPAANYLTFCQMVENDMLADLSEVYEKCAGDYLRATYDSFDGRNLDPLTFDGKLYGVTSANIGYGHNLLWLRADWMEKLNLDPPKTLDDLKYILKEFMEKDPGENGEGNTLGLALNATEPVNGYGSKFSADPIFHSVGAYPKQWMSDESGKVYYGSTAPEMKEGLAILRSMYEEGLIDKQFLTRVGAGETDAIVDAGLAGAWFAPWWGGNVDIYSNNPEARLMPVNAPLDENGEYNHLTPAPTGDIIVVNKNCKNPEALLKIINLEYDIYRGINKEGMEAVKPVFDQGVSREALFPTGGFNLDYYDVVPELGRLTKELVETGVMNDNERTTDYDRWKAEGARRFADGVDPSDENAKNNFSDYNGRYLGSNILDTPENHPVTPAYSYTTESSVSLKPTLDKMEQQMCLQIIIGEKDIDYFDEFVDQWYKLGGQTLTDEVQAIIDARK